MEIKWWKTICRVFREVNDFQTRGQIEDSFIQRKETHRLLEVQHWLEKLEKEKK